MTGSALRIFPPDCNSLRKWIDIYTDFYQNLLIFTDFYQNLLNFALSSLGLKASLRKWIYLETNNFLSEAFRPSE